MRFASASDAWDNTNVRTLKDMLFEARPFRNIEAEARLSAFNTKEDSEDAPGAGSCAMHVSNIYISEIYCYM
jgi:hypothetical protein